MATIPTSLRERFSRDVGELTSSLIELRRDFHKYPELAFEEHRTMQRVAERLREIGIEPRTGVGGTGVIAIIDTGTPGRTVLARAELDGLPVVEANEVDYRSTARGRMHACGHDANMAILLAAAAVWQRSREALNGRIVLVFQPAEEAGRGARAMLDDGALHGIEVDTAVDLHVSANHPTGVVGVHDGQYTCSTDAFRIQVQGVAGHAASPANAIDPVSVAARIVLALGSLVPNEVSPMDRAVVGVTTINGGSSPNVIPDIVELTGSVRAFRSPTRELLLRRVEEISEATARTHRATCRTVWGSSTPPLFNTSSTVADLKRCAASIPRVTEVIDKSPTMGGEDFGYWAQAAKASCYFFIGSNGGSTSAWPHHHPNFDIDESVLPIAAELLSVFVAEALTG